jgi:lipopolysaccharide transport system permease protein
MVGVIGGFRWILLGSGPPTPIMVISISIVLLLLVTGALYFRRMEKGFADVI